ncbi:hypothetical protein PC123_g19695 [Phytophthora cactorum]|nr:hypothetical protein PC123_g19695 [Phytophthora cactorum]
MRAFMRAIGLGGLFRRSANSTAKASTANNTAGSFRVLTLEQFEKMTTVDNSAVFEARRSSSTNERPQFLFFCGSDNSAFPSGELTSPNGSTLASRFASMNAPTPAQPVIDHHMPVFFMPPLSPSRLSDPRCLIAFSTENHSTDRSNVKRYWSFACSNFDNVLKMSGKTEKELQIRLKKLQQGNSIDKLQQLTQLIPLNFPLKLQTTRKEISLQQLKKSHQEQIQQNLFTAKEHRKQELAARENIVKEQERPDKSCEDREAQRKHQLTASYSYHATDLLPSRDPVRYSERLKGFQRPMTVQEPSQSPVIYSKQRCRSVVVLILQL